MAGETYAVEVDRVVKRFGSLRAARTGQARRR